MDKKVIGIIGGMGPLATADLFKKIITNTKVLKDQDHIRVLIDNNTENGTETVNSKGNQRFRTS